MPTTFTWTGNGADDLWSNPANWDIGVPADGADVRIAATANSAEVLFDASVPGSGVTINSLTSDGSNPVSEPFRITGSTLTLAGAGPFAVGAGFDNGGLVNVGANVTFTLSNGGTSTGDWDIAATGSLTITSAPYLFDNGTDVTGAGMVVVTQASQAGTLNVGDEAADVVNVSNLRVGPSFSQGTVNATGTLHVTGQMDLGFNNGNGFLSGAGNVTVGGLLSMFSGGMSGPGTTSANGGMLLQPGGNGTILKDGRHLDNNATATWPTNTPHALDFRNGAVFTNNGTVDLQVDASMSSSNGGGDLPNAIINTGIFKKTGGGASPNTILVPFNNNGGTVDVQVGELLLRGGGTSTGPWTVAAAAQLSFFDSTYDLNAGSKVTGDGKVLFAFSTVNMADTYSASHTEIIFSAHANFNAESSTTTLTFPGIGDGSTLGGSANFTVNGLLTWTTGIIAGAGTVFAKGDVTLSGNSALTGRTLDLAANHTLTGLGALTMSGGAVFNNNGTFDAQADQPINYGGGFQPIFINNGIFRKSAASGTTTINVAFTNNGTLDVQTGTVSLNGPNGGLTNFPVASTAFIDGSPTGATESGTTVTITTSGHQFLVVGQQVTVSGVAEAGYNGTFTVTAVPSQSSFQYTAATSGLPDSGNGTATFLSTSTLTGGTYLISGTLQFPGANLVTNAANIVLNGPASAFLNSAPFPPVDALSHFATNAAGGSFTLRGGRSLTTGAAFENAGTMTIAAGSTLAVGGAYTQTAGTTTLDGTLSAAADIQNGRLEGSGSVNGDLTNAAQVRVGGSPGVLTVNGGYTQTSAGSLDVEIGGPTAGTQFDQFVVTGAAALDGTVNVTRLGGFVPGEPDAFRIVSAGSRTGTFATLTGSSFPGGRFALLDDATGTLLDANVAPTPADDSDHAVQGHALTTDVVANDTDPDGDSLTVIAVGASAQGVTPVNNGDGTVTYTPPAGFRGADAFTYTVRDTVGNEATANVTITVTPVNAAPTLDLIPDPAAVPEDSAVQAINLTGISAGTGDVQSLTVTATSDNPGLIPDPTVTYQSPDVNGSLHFAPVPNRNGTAVITVTVRDDGGTAFGGVDEVTRTFTVTVTAVPDAPTIDTAPVPMLPAVPLNPPPTNPAGAPVADLLGAATDADGDPLGLAITGIDNRKGAWQFSTNGGSNWNPVPVNVSPTAALVLSADAGTRVRFLPTRGFQGLASLSFRAWDGSDGATVGTQVDSTLTPAACSPETERAWVAVGKTSPAVNVTGATVLPAVREDSKASQTFPAKGLLGIAGLEHEPATNLGLAITGLDQTGGRWQFRLAGTKAFVDVGPVSASSALLLRPTDSLRFLPDPNADGQTAVTFRTWDQSGAAGTKVDPVGPGFGRDPGSAVLDIAAVNDAPVLDLSAPAALRPVNAGETTDEPTFAALIRAADVDGPAAGVAVVGARGLGWEFNAGGGWVPVGTVSSGKALLLDASARVRFVAPAGAAPGTATLSLKAWDEAAGSGAVGARAPVRGTAFSRQTEVATVAVGNTAPVLDTTPDVTLPTVASGSTRPIAGTPVKALLGTAVTDTAGSLRGIAVVFADNANGRWQYSLGGSVFLDVGPAGPGTALLLTDTSKVRFVPNAGFTGLATLQFKAWDRTTGQAGDRIDTGPPLNAFSLEVETATVTVV